MPGDPVATFGISIPTDTNANESANSVDELRKAILASQDAVKAYGGTLRNLRGDSDAVKVAKTNLKAAVNAERDAISRNTLALGAQGKTLFEAKAKTAALSKPVGELKKVMGDAKGPAADLSKHIEELTSTFGSGFTAANVLVGGFTLVAGAILAVGAAALAGAVSLGKFILESGNELRTMGLYREAAMGSAENSKAFGHQIEVLAQKIPLGTKELSDLSIGLYKTLRGSQISGQGIVDTFNAVGQASAAMGASTGDAIGEIITRGKTMGRIGFGVREFQEKGLNFTDVAKQLSTNLKISLLDAQTALTQHRVPIDAGAKAIREVLEKRFGKVNLALMTDLPTIGKKLKDSLRQLTEGVNLAPVLEGLASLASLFDKSTVAGKAMKDFITSFGNTIGKIFTEAVPLVRVFVTQLLIETVKLRIVFADISNYIEDTFGVSLGDLGGQFFTLENAVTAAKVVLWGTVGVMGALLAVGTLLAAPFLLLAAAWEGAGQAGKDFGAWLRKEFLETDWSRLGSNLIDGIVNGFRAGLDRLKEAVTGGAEAAKNAFKTALGIHSPSRVFAEYGEQTTAGFAQGVAGSRSMAGAAVASMVKVPSSQSGSAGSGGPVSVSLTLNFPNVKDGEGVRKELSGASFKSEFLRVLEEALQGQGAPTAGAT